jgi:hypothetical protein
LGSPALRLVRGAAEPSTVTLGLAVASVRCWERNLDRAFDDLLDPASKLSQHEAWQRVEATHLGLLAARNRRDRVICELGGERWLWPVEGGGAQ